MRYSEEQRERRMQRDAYKRQNMTLEQRNRELSMARRRKAAASNVLTQSQVADTVQSEHGSPERNGHF